MPGRWSGSHAANAASANNHHAARRQKIKQRGLEITPDLAVGDGALGFWKAIDEVFQGSRHQRCWVHKTANVLNKVALSVQVHMRADLREIYAAPSGWVVGGGVEWALGGNWSAKLEYDFLKLDDLTFGPGPFRGDTFTASREIQMFKVGLNYRFGSLFGGGYGGAY